MTSPADGKRVMLSALDQWEGVEEFAKVAKRYLPPAACQELDQSTAVHAEEALEILSETRATPVGAPSRNGTYALPSDVPPESTMEMSLRAVLRRLQSKKLAEAI